MTHRPTLRTVVGALALIAAVLTTTGALAAEPKITVPAHPTDLDVTPADEQAAKDGYARIQEAFGREDFEDALRHADAVFNAVPNASTALIRAAILKQMKRHKDAFLTFLLATQLNPTKKEKSSITKGLAAHGRAAKPRLGGLAVEGGGDDASCEADGVTWACKHRVAVQAGTVSVTVTAPGFEPKSVKVRVRAGKIRTTRVKLKEAAVVVGPGDGGGGDGTAGDGTTGDGTTGSGDGTTGSGDGTAGDGTTGDGTTGGGDGTVEWGKYKPPSRGTNVGAWLLVGVGTGALIGGGVMHGFAFGAKSDADALALPNDGLDDEDRQRRYDNAKDSATSNETAAFILYGAGAAALVGGIIWLAADDDSSSSVHVAPMVGPTGGGLSAAGRF